MANIHPSHYFNSAEYYLHNANGPKNCQEIENLIKKDGCPDEKIQSVFNGLMIDFMYDILPYMQDNVKVYDPDGNAIYTQKYLFTKPQWIDALCNTFVGLSKERATCILDYMCDRDMIIKDTNGILYRGMAPGKRNPVELTFA